MYQLNIVKFILENEMLIMLRSLQDFANIVNKEFLKDSVWFEIG